MGRRPRIEFEGALHHVFPRGNRREPIIHTDRDCRICERYFIEAARQTDVIPRAWHPMPNHFHGLIETPHANLAEFMQRWLGRYARYYNRVYEKVGHLFQGRYGSRLVQKETYLKEVIRYIALQRHRAKDPSSVNSFFELYSSHRFYMGETCTPEIVVWIEPILKLFSDDIHRARLEYAKFLADGLKNGKWKHFYKPKNGIIGDDHFIEHIGARIQTKEARATLSTDRHPIVMAKLLRTAAETFDIDTGEFVSASQGRELSRIRQAVAYVGRQLGLSVTELAKGLHRGLPAVSSMIKLAKKQAPEQVERLSQRTNFESSKPDTNDVALPVVSIITDTI